MKVTVHNLKSFNNNEVADLEVLIPFKNNNADFVNDVLIPAIFNTGFHAINNEYRWCKNKKRQNVLMFFGATEGRTNIKQVVSTIEQMA